MDLRSADSGACSGSTNTTDTRQTPGPGPRRPVGRPPRELEPFEERLEARGIPVMKLRLLLLPESYEALPTPVELLDPRSLLRSQDEAGRVLVCGVASVIEQAGSDAQRPCAGIIADSAGHRLHFIASESARRPLNRFLSERATPKRRIWFLADMVRRSTGLVLLDPEPIPNEVVRRGVRPIYAVNRQTFAAQVRKVDDLDLSSYLAKGRVQNVIRENLEAQWVNWLKSSTERLIEAGLKSRRAQRAALGFPKGDAFRDELSKLLRAAHFPSSLNEAREATGRLDHVAAVCVMSELISDAENDRKNVARRRRMALVLEPSAAFDLDAYFHSLMVGVPFELTADQREAVIDTLVQINTGIPLRRVLCGDVGSGKTVVYSLIAKAIVRAGGRVGIMAPTEVLAQQIHKRVSEFAPGVRVDLVAGRSAPSRSPAPICVGTTALISRMGSVFHLVIVDEQHRYSREQREELLESKGHLLEVTATPIPRTVFLLVNKVNDVVYLNSAHVKRDVRTRVWNHNRRRDLFKEIRSWVGAGQQVLVIYVAKKIQEKAEAANDVDLTQIATGTTKERLAVRAFEDTWRKNFGDKVRVCDGSMTPDEKSDALKDMAEGRASVMVATTVVEVGIDLPYLRNIVVLQADLFGLIQLHQLRGRVARSGGAGNCELYLSYDVPPTKFKLLQAFAKELDGFKVAELDLDSRGAGDVSRYGHRQSGQLPESPFGNRQLLPRQLEKASEALLAAPTA